MRSAGKTDLPAERFIILNPLFNSQEKLKID